MVGCVLCESMNRIPTHAHTAVQTHGTPNGLDWLSAAAVGAATMPLDPKSGAAMGAAGAIAASSDCRKALSEVMRRITQRERDADDRNREREARDHWERIDKDNYDLEQYDRYRNTA